MPDDPIAVQQGTLGTILTIIRAQNWEATFEGRADGKTELQLIGWALTTEGSPAAYDVKGIVIDPDTGHTNISEFMQGFTGYRMSRFAVKIA